MPIKFGPAGMCEMAAAEKIKSTEKLMVWLSEKDLNAFEYQCGRGVRLSAEKAELIKTAAKNAGITISLHAPYFISLASLEEEKRNNSVEYIRQSAEAVQMLGGNRIVVHPGGLSKMSREEARAIACETLVKAQNTLDEMGLTEVHICPEVMGKINQLGDLEDVITFCKIDERFIPCVDFGHLNSRTVGLLQSTEDYIKVFDTLSDALGTERTKNMHVHFSKIEYSKGGEVRHLTFEDSIYGPEPDIFIESIVKYGMTPTVICESAGTQTADSVAMLNLYKEKYKGE